MWDFSGRTRCYLHTKIKKKEHLLRVTLVRAIYYMFVQDICGANRLSMAFHRKEKGRMYNLFPLLFQLQSLLTSRRQRHPRALKQVKQAKKKKKSQWIKTNTVQ